MNNYNNLRKTASNAIEYCSNNNKFQIHIFNIPSDGSKKISVLINELVSRNIAFSIKIEKEKQTLIIFISCLNNKKEESNKRILQYLKEIYKLKQIENSDEFFFPNIKKIEREEDNILKLKFNSNKETSVFTCILTEINSNNYMFQRNFTLFLRDLIQAEIFSIVISYSPNYEKNKGYSPSWGLIFSAENKEFHNLAKNKQNFLRYIGASSIKLNCKLKVISKNELNRNQINFRFCVPWIKHQGYFYDAIDIDQLLLFKRDEKKEISITSHKEQPEIQIPNQSQRIEQTNTISLYRPFPSAKTLRRDELEVKPHADVNKPNDNQLKAELKNEKIAPSNIDDMLIPVPRTMNTVFDSEYLKVRISKIFRNLEFKETIIFEDSFDLVLRKGSSYVFIKFFQNTLTQSQANDIVDALSSIAGLRNQFICIVVTDVIEESSKKILNEYNILHLTLQDILLEETLKSKIYNTILV